VSLSTGRYQVASITQNNHVYEDLVEYFRSEVSLNLGSQVNVQNALPSTYNPNTICYLPCRSATSEITSTARLQRQRAPHPLPSRICRRLRQLQSLNSGVKKELPVLEYMDRGYVVTCLLQRQRAPLCPLKSADALRQLRTLNTSTVLPHTIDKLIAPLCLLL